jgi:hypothetical protein
MKTLALLCAALVAFAALGEGTAWADCGCSGNPGTITSDGTGFTPRGRTTPA